MERLKLSYFSFRCAFMMDLNFYKYKQFCFSKVDLPRAYENKAFAPKI